MKTCLAFILLATTAWAAVPLPIYKPAGGTYVVSPTSNTKEVLIEMTDKRPTAIFYSLDNGVTWLEGTTPVIVQLPAGRTALKAYAVQKSETKLNTYTVNPRATPRPSTTPSPTPLPTPRPSPSASPTPTVTPSPTPIAVNRADVELGWRWAAPAPATSRYRLHYGRTRTSMTRTKDSAGDKSTGKITLDATGLWFVSLTARDMGGQEGPVSNVIALNYAP